MDASQNLEIRTKKKLIILFIVLQRRHIINFVLVAPGSCIFDYEKNLLIYFGNLYNFQPRREKITAGKITNISKNGTMQVANKRRYIRYFITFVRYNIFNGGVNPHCFMAI